MKLTNGGKILNPGKELLVTFWEILTKTFPKAKNKSTYKEK